MPATRHDVRSQVTDRLPIVAGVTVAIAVWIIGGRAGWANGMVVTPREAVAPIFGESSDVYLRATKATVWAALRHTP